MANKTIDGTANIEAVRFKESAAPATPASGYGKVYAKTDGKLYWKNDAGTEFILSHNEGARVYNNGALSISHNTPTALTFDSEDYDTDTMHDTGSNTSRITITSAGVYIVTANAQWDNVATITGRRQLNLRIDGTTTIANTEFVPDQSLSAAKYPSLTVTTVYTFTAGQYVEAVAYHNHGTTINLLHTLESTPYFSAQRIG